MVGVGFVFMAMGLEVKWNIARGERKLLNLKCNRVNTDKIILGFIKDFIAFL